jgi:hypothetical protein
MDLEAVARRVVRSVGDALAAEGVRVVVLGSPGEAPLAQRGRSDARAAAVLAGELDLGTKAVMRRRACWSATTRARGAWRSLGVPSVVLFGPTSLAKTSLNWSACARSPPTSRVVLLPPLSDRSPLHDAARPRTRRRIRAAGAAR